MSRKRQKDKKKIKKGRGPTVKLRPRQDAPMHDFKHTSTMKSSNKKRTSITGPSKASRMSVSKTSGKQTKKMDTLMRVAESVINKKNPEFTISYIKEIQKELNAAFYGSKFNKENKKYTGQAIVESDLEQLQEKLHNSVIKLQSNSQLKKDIDYCKLREHEVNKIFALYDKLLNKGRDIYTNYAQEHPQVQDGVDEITLAFGQQGRL
jgi:phosphotransferase system IIA component